MKPVVICSILSGFVLMPIVSVAQMEPEALPPRRMMKRGEWNGARPGMIQGEGKHFDGVGAASEFIETVKRENPERFEELMRLRETDKVAFMKELRKLAQERRGKVGERGRKGRRPQDTRCAELSKQFHAAESTEDKARLKEELGVAVKEAFEARLNNSIERLKQLEGEIERFRTHIRKLEKNREEVVGRRVDELTRSPELNWDARW